MSNDRFNLVVQIRDYKKKMPKDTIEAHGEAIIDALGGVNVILEHFLSNARFLKANQVQHIHRILSAAKDGARPPPSKRGMLVPNGINIQHAASTGNLRGDRRTSLPGGIRGRGSLRARGRGAPRGGTRGTRGRGSLRARGGGRGAYMGGSRTPQPHEADAPQESSSEDDLNDSEDSDEAPNRGTTESAAKAGGWGETITSETNFDASGQGPAILSPDPSAMVGAPVGRLREDKSRRYSISAKTDWDDNLNGGGGGDGGGVEQSYNYFAGLQTELTTRRDRARRSISRRSSLVSLNMADLGKKKRKKKMGRSASTAHISIDASVSMDSEQLRALHKRRQSFADVVDQNMSDAETAHKNGGKKLAISAKAQWAKMGGDDDDADDDMDVDLDAVAYKAKAVAKKRVSKVQFAELPPASRSNGGGMKTPVVAEDSAEDDDDMDDDLASDKEDTPDSVVKHGSTPRRHSKSKSKSKSKKMADAEAESSSSSSDDSSSSEDESPTKSKSSTAAVTAAAAAAVTNTNMSKRARRNTRQRRPSDQVRDILNDIAPDEDGDDSDGGNTPNGSATKRPKRQDKQRRPSDQVKNILDEIAPDDDDDSDDDDTQKEKEVALLKRKSLARRKSQGKELKDTLNGGNASGSAETSKRPKRKDKERRASDQVKNLLDQIAPDGDTDSAEEEVDIRKEIAEKKRISIQRRESAVRVKDLLNRMASTHSTRSDATDEEDSKQQVPALMNGGSSGGGASGKRPKRKDKERRPSDQVKSILDTIAPDDEDDSEEEVDIRKEIAENKRKSIKRTMSAADRLHDVLNTVAPGHDGDENEVGDDETANGHESATNRPKRKDKQRRPSDQVKNILDEIAPDDDDDSDDDEKEKEVALLKRKSLARRKSQGKELKDTLSNGGSGGNANGSAETSKRPKRKDKERRPSDQVKSILDTIAPDEEDDSDDDDIRKEIAQNKRKSMKRTESAADRIQAALNAVAPGDDAAAAGDDEEATKKPVPAKVSTPKASAKLKKRESVVDQVKNLLDAFAPEDGDDDTDDETPNHAHTHSRTESQKSALAQSSSNLSAGGIGPDDDHVPMKRTASNTGNDKRKKKEPALTNKASAKTAAKSSTAKTQRNAKTANSKSPAARTTTPKHSNTKTSSATKTKTAASKPALANAASKSQKRKPTNNKVPLKPTLSSKKSRGAQATSNGSSKKNTPNQGSKKNSKPTTKTTKTNAKTKSRKKADSDVDSEEEREMAWYRLQQAKKSNTKKPKTPLASSKKKVPFGDDDDGDDDDQDELSDASNSSGF